MDFDGVFDPYMSTVWFLDDNHALNTTVRTRANKSPLRDLLPYCNWEVFRERRVLMLFSSDAGPQVAEGRLSTAEMRDLAT